PEGDASVMSTDRKFFSNRHYQSGGRNFTLDTLAHWVRRNRGLKGSDTKALPLSQILKEWKKELFGIEEKEVERSLIPLQLDFSISDFPTEEEVGRIVQAIVAQDQELYPEGDASVMKTGRKYGFRRYQGGGHDFTLDTLAGWVLQARGLKARDRRV